MEGRGCPQWKPVGSQWSLGGSVDQGSQIRITLMRSRIRIRIKVMRIRNRDAMISPKGQSITHGERQKLWNGNKGACPYLKSPAVQEAGPEGGVR